jgi:hypothetical protein
MLKEKKYEMEVEAFLSHFGKKLFSYFSFAGFFKKCLSGF